MVVLPILLLLLGSSPTSRAADEELAELTVLEPHASCSGHRSGCRCFVLLARARRRSSRRRGRSRRWLTCSGRTASVSTTSIGGCPAPVVPARAGAPSSSIHLAATDGSSTPPVTVVLDTAGDVPWMRCVLCTFTQCADYDPTRSSTYAAFPCNSSACKQLGRYANGCDGNGRCQYIVAGEKFTTSGTYSSDVLTINSGAGDTVRAFRFGCSQNEQGSFENQADGIMALGRGAQSLMAQTSSTYGDAFSYCLPPTETTKGFFQIGVPIGASYRFVTTPMLKDRGGPPSAAASLYRALLLAITVDGKALNVPPEVFAAGTVVDSRTIITRLRAAFRNRMTYRAAPPQEELDTCYDLTGVRYPRLPRIALVFDGNAVAEMDRSGILLDGCLAFASNDDDSSPSIQVLHDVGGGRIGFRSAAC